MILGWHEGNGQWRKSIGQARSQDGKRLVQKFFYFAYPNTAAGKERAIRDALAIKDQWRALKTNWDRDYRPLIELIDPDNPFPNEPHWTEGALRQIGRTKDKSSPPDVAAREKALQTAYHTRELDEDEVAEHFADVTLRAVQGLYLRYQRDRVGRADGIKLQTYRQTELELGRAMEGIDPASKLADVRRSHLDAFKAYWMRLPNGMQPRTAANYCKAVKGMLDWAYGSEVSGDTPKPKGYDEVFTFKKYKRPDVRTYSPDQLRELLAHEKTSDRMRLYCLLALNCGMYPVDIESLRKSDLDLKAGYVLWARQKTEGQNDFRTRHDLWPETIRLLRQEMAATGDLAFVRDDGTPLRSTYASGNQYSHIRHQVWHWFGQIGKPYRFTDFRKTGYNAIKVRGNELLAKQYDAHAIAGVSKFYDAGDLRSFDQMNVALKQWGDDLRGAGVFDWLQRE